MNETLFVAPALAATLSALAVWLLARTARALPPDIPNARSLHVQPVPRAGGYAIWAGFIPAALLFAPPFPVEWKVWLPGWAALTLVSAMDDVTRRPRGGGAVGGSVAGWSGPARDGRRVGTRVDGSDRAGDRVVGEPL